MAQIVKNPLFSSATQSCPTLWDPTDCSMPGFPVLPYLPDLAQTHVLWVGDAIQPSHPLSFPSPPTLQSFTASGSFLMSQLLASGGQSIGASASAWVLPVSIQGWFPLGLTGLISLQSKEFSQESSPAPQFQSIKSSVLSLLYDTILTSIQEYWKNRRFDYMDLCRQSNASAF